MKFYEPKQVPTNIAEELEKETAVEPPESDHPKCADLVVANRRWSLTRIEPQEVSLRRKLDTSTLRKIIYCVQFPSYDMCSSMLLLFLPQEIRNSSGGRLQEVKNSPNYLSRALTGGGSTVLPQIESKSPFTTMRLGFVHGR